MQALQVLLIPNLQIKGRSKPDPLQRSMSWPFSNHLGDRRAKSSNDAVLLQCNEVPALRSSGDHRLDVERMHCVHAEQPDSETSFLEGVGYRDRRLKHSAGRD